MTPELSDRHLIEPKDPLSQTFLFWESDLLDVEHMMFLLIYNGPFTFGTFLSTYFKKKTVPLRHSFAPGGVYAQIYGQILPGWKKSDFPRKKKRTWNLQIHFCLGDF